MNVRLTRRERPQLTETFGGVGKVLCDGEMLYLARVETDRDDAGRLPLRGRTRLRDVAEIVLDEDCGSIW